MDWLDHGSVVRSGPTREVVGAYLAEGISGNAEWRPSQQVSQQFELHSVSIDCDAAADRVSIPADSDFEIEFDFTVRGTLPPGRLALLVAESGGQTIFASASTDSQGAATQSTPDTPQTAPSTSQGSAGTQQQGAPQAAPQAAEPASGGGASAP